MSVSATELTIIADDGRGLSSVDRESIREAAADLERITAAYFKLQQEFCELHQAHTAQVERIAELTKKPFNYDVLRVSYHVYPLPSWARFSL